MRKVFGNIARALLAAAAFAMAGCALIYSGAPARRQAPPPKRRPAEADPAPAATNAASQAATETFDFDAFWAMPTNLPYNATYLSRGSGDGIRWQGVMFTSEMFKGQPMRVFGWYATPAGGGPHPAVLSLHGAGGGADLPRAKEFARAGYACLSIDWNTFGEAGPRWADGDPLPACEKSVFCGIWYQNWPGHFCMPGPDGDWKWCALYRAAMAARRGIAWMAARKEIDPEKIAVEGHSFGGLLSQLVAGIEPRVKAAVSSAAAGAWESRLELGLEAHMKESGMTLDQGREFLRRYDPAACATNIAAPILLRLAAADFFGSYETLPEYWPGIPAEKRLELMPGPNHHFDDVGARVAWFDSCFRGAPEYPSIVSWKASSNFFGGKWSASLRARGGRPIKYAEISWTTSTNEVWMRREWCSAPLVDKGDGRFEGEFEPVATGAPLRCFVTVLDDLGRGASAMPETKKLRASGGAPQEPVRKAAYAVASAAAAPDEKEWAKAASAGPAAREASTLASERVSFRALRKGGALLLRIEAKDSSPWRAAGEPGAKDAVRIAVSAPGNGEGPAARFAWKPDAGGGAAPDDAESTPPATVVLGRDGYALCAEVPLASLGGDPAGGALRFDVEVDFGCCCAPECLGTVRLGVDARFED